MRLLFVLLFSFFLFGLGLAQSEQNQVSIKRSETGGSCIKRFQPNDPILLGQVYVKSGGRWTAVSDAKITSIPTTRISIWDADLGRTVGKAAYEYIYVADLRNLPEKYAVVGIVAARSTDTGQYPEISLHRNRLKTSTGYANAYNESVNTDHYQGYIKNPKDGPVVREIDNWMDVPGYDGEADTSRSAFLYRAQEKRSTHWKIALKLRAETGNVSCVPFELAHDARVRFVNLRTFIQRQNEQIEEFTADFK